MLDTNTKAGPARPCHLLVDAYLVYIGYAWIYLDICWYMFWYMFGIFLVYYFVYCLVYVWYIFSIVVGRLCLCTTH